MFFYALLPFLAVMISLLNVRLLLLLFDFLSFLFINQTSHQTNFFSCKASNYLLPIVILILTEAMVNNDFSANPVYSAASYQKRGFKGGGGERI